MMSAGSIQGYSVVKEQSGIRLGRAVYHSSIVEHLLKMSRQKCEESGTQSIALPLSRYGTLREFISVATKALCSAREFGNPWQGGAGWAGLSNLVI